MALARALQAAPQMLPALQTLDLDDNSIGDKGAAALAHALQAKPQMLPELQTLKNVSSVTDITKCFKKPATSTRPWNSRHAKRDRNVAKIFYVEVLGCILAKK